MTSRWAPLTDDLLREALTDTPATDLVDRTFDVIHDRVERSPQRMRTFAWPWSAAMPDVTRSSRRQEGFTLAALIALLLVAALVGALLIGSRPRPPVLFGLDGWIAFDSGGEIYLAKPDGSSPRQITSGGAAGIRPVFSPDGSMLAYESLDAVAAQVHLTVIRGDGSGPTVVATTPAVQRPGGPAIAWPRVSWSPDGRRLAYTAPGGGAQQVFVVNVDGTDPHPVGDPALEGHDPAWSADGQLLAFLGGRYDDEKGVYVMRTDGSGLLRIGPPSGLQWAFEYQPPVWAPTGHRLAFSARPDRFAQIFVADVDAGARTSLSPSCCDDEWGPAWSADGRYLAWHRGQVNVDGQFVVAAGDGSGGLSLLAAAVRGGPVWSADGTALLGYRTDPDTGLRNLLVIVDVVGGGHIEIPVGPGGDPNTGLRDRVSLVDGAGGGRVEFPAGPGGDATWQVASP